MINTDFFSGQQNRATDPTKNIWVQANAGTGKTTVLVKRLLKILFYQAQNNVNNINGILCLTYTNAAAGEMRKRILDSLMQWAKADDDTLINILNQQFPDISIDKFILSTIRNIFFTYIDNPDMLKIKTIHGFCEEILHRFPLEAGIRPAWTLISDNTQHVLLQESFYSLAQLNITDEKSAKIVENFYKLVDLISENFLPDLLDILLSLYKGVFCVENIDFYRETFTKHLKQFLHLTQEIDITPNKAQLSNILHQTKLSYFNKNKLPLFIQNVIRNTEMYITGDIDFSVYKSAYLTNTNTPSKNIQQSNLVFLINEQNRVYEIQNYLSNKTVFDNTMALFDLSIAFTDIYREKKLLYNVLDFDDLILYTKKLFSNKETMGWVLSQLDISLNHILVDEAQDTSPEQWDILCLLLGDFFVEGNDNKHSKSLFVVGDTKQSIYSFQGAKPEAFITSRNTIEKTISNYHRKIENIPLEANFRSVAPILKTVDTFFNNETVKNITGFINNPHICVKTEENGIVEIHKSIEYNPQDSERLKKYINTITNKIHSLITNDKISPNDIMILLKEREPFAPLLSKALKKLNIPVAGNDRINLSKFIAIKDMLNLLRFCLDYKDNYSLCCILKSPFYRLKELDIFNLSTETKQQKNTCFFETLQTQYPNIYKDLQDTIFASKNMGPFSFFSYLLNKNDNKKNMVKYIGKQVLDPLDEFINICLSYERTQPGTLKHFLKWFITGNNEIKRDMDSSSGIRIMSIHGSKGLASDVVFLIDTIDIPDTNQIINIEQSNSKFWLWTKGCNSAEITMAKTIAKQKNLEEYYRLLYVAMTRAKNRLYVYGYDNHITSDKSWHSLLWNTLAKYKTDDDTIIINNDTVL